MEKHLRFLFIKTIITYKLCKNFLLLISGYKRKIAHFKNFERYVTFLYFNMST